MMSDGLLQYLAKNMALLVQNFCWRFFLSKSSFIYRGWEGARGHASPLPPRGFIGGHLHCPPRFLLTTYNSNFNVIIQSYLILRFDWGGEGVILSMGEGLFFKGYSINMVPQGTCPPLTPRNSKKTIL